MSEDVRTTITLTLLAADAAAYGVDERGRPRFGWRLQVKSGSESKETIGVYPDSDSDSDPAVVALVRDALERHQR